MACASVPWTAVLRVFPAFPKPATFLRSALFGAALAFPAATAVAAPPDYRPVSTADGEQLAVREGADLERSRRWIDAIQHYEASLEQYPENEYIKYGLRRAKIHFGVERRYADGSFETGLLAKTPADVLNLFDEILAEVRAHYVEPVSATSFTAHGTESLYLALANEKFLGRHLPNADAAKVARLRQTLRETYWNKNVEGSGRPRLMIQEVCRLARGEVGLAETAVVLEYVFGGCNALDDYSSYLTSARLADLYGNIEGEFVGLGIEMQAEAGRGMRLDNVLPDSPAQTGGMRAGEYIVAIDGRDCRDMSTDEAANLLRGPTGSTVELEIASAAGDGRRGRFVRRPVVVHSIEEVTMLDRQDGIGYFRMTGFQKNTPEELDAAIADLKRQGMRKLIWDLRGNPGGLLPAAVEVLDRFIAEGPLVSTKGRNFDQNWSYSAHRSGTHTDLELVLLVDGDSASASEIVAGAVRDYKRGTIVGRKTYGKWSVQTIYPVRDKTGLRVTTAKFYSPHDHNYAKIGLEPDVTVPLASAERRTYVRPSTDREEFLNHPDTRAALAAFGAGRAITSR